MMGRYGNFRKLLATTMSPDNDPLMNNSESILYVEDNMDNFKLVRRVLMAEGFSVYGAIDGREAFAFLEEQVPALILMDINLPYIDGYTLAGQIRQQTNFAHIPIVALTANVMKQDHDKSIEAGCDGFIRKPIDVDLLPDQIRAYLAANNKAR
jgi:two-component system cell cycle response regulator DivK